MILTLLDTNNNSGASTSEFTSNLDGTYDEYMFVTTNFNPSAEASITFQVSTDGGSNYGVTCTTTTWDAHNFEQVSGGSPDLSYDTGQDIGSGTGEVALQWSTGSGGDESHSGILHLFNPASTTYVKHFYSRISAYRGDDSNTHAFAAGYFNTTSAINAIRWHPGAGKTFDSVIQMYGVA